MTRSGPGPGLPVRLGLPTTCGRAVGDLACVPRLTSEFAGGPMPRRAWSWPRRDQLSRARSGRRGIRPPACGQSVPRRTGRQFPRLTGPQSPGSRAVSHQGSRAVSFRAHGPGPRHVRPLWCWRAVSLYLSSWGGHAPSCGGPLWSSGFCETLPSVALEAGRVRAAFVTPGPSHSARVAL